MTFAKFEVCDVRLPYSLTEEVWAHLPEVGGIDFYMEDQRLDHHKYLLVRTCATKAEARALAALFALVALPAFIDVYVYRLRGYSTRK